MSAATIIRERQVSALACDSLLADLAGRPMALLPEAGERLVRMLKAGDKRGILAASPRQSAPQRNTSNVAGVGLIGVLFGHGNFLTDIGYGTALDQFTSEVQAAANDPSIDSIILLVDSPGGTVGGTEQASLAVQAAAKIKPVVAVVDTLAASGAYWIASNASEVVLAPEGECGSIGVYQQHVDYSRELDAAGIKVTYVKAGKKKTDGNPYEPLNDQSRQTLQAGVDDFHQMFLAAVARGRGVAVSTVTNDFGQGATVRARQAIAAGMADRIGTLQGELSRLRNVSSGARANSIRPAMRATHHDVEVEQRREKLRVEAEIESGRQKLRAEEARERRESKIVSAELAKAYTPSKSPVTPQMIYTAFHEAGHLVARWYYGDRSCTATIVSTDKYRGAVFPGETLDSFAEAVMAYAGCEAGDLSPVPPESRAQAGSADQRLAEKALEQSGQYAEARRKAASIVRDNWRTVRAMAAALVEKRTLSAADVAEVVREFRVV